MNNKKELISRGTITAVVIACVLAAFAFGRPGLAKTITIEEGKTYQLKVKKGSKIKCSNKKIVKINKKGKMKALKKGKCTVNVKYKKKQCKYCVKVTKKTDDILSMPTDSLPSPTPALLNGGKSMYYGGLYVDKIVQKDAETCYIYMGRNPKAEYSPIAEDAPYKYIMIEITYEVLEGPYKKPVKEGDYVGFLKDINAETELIGDTLYVKDKHNSIMNENGLYQYK